MSTDLDSQRVEVPSRRYGKYTLKRRLGAGGMADVFLGEVLDEAGRLRQVALKLLRSGAEREAFAAEADLMGLLEHPNLVQKLEFGEAFGRPFIAMEYLLAGDLRRLMGAHQRVDHRFPKDLGVHLCLEVLKGLAYFHRAVSRTGRRLGLIHGDINPENVFFSGSGQVKLGDFGVAKSHSMNLGPQDGMVAGKLRYLSPEQCRGEPLTPSSDLFAVGIMLCELTCGRHPFASPEATEEELFELLRTGKVAIPWEKGLLGNILRRALHPSPLERYRTAGAFGADLCQYALDLGRSLSDGEVRDYVLPLLGISRVGSGD